MQAVSMRDKLFTMRVSEEETARLEDLALHYGLNQANVLRMLVKQRWDEITRDAGAKRGTKGAKR